MSLQLYSSDKVKRPETVSLYFPDACTCACACAPLPGRAGEAGIAISLFTPSDSALRQEVLEALSQAAGASASASGAGEDDAGQAGPSGRGSDDEEEAGTEQVGEVGKAKDTFAHLNAWATGHSLQHWAVCGVCKAAQLCFQSSMVMTTRYGVVNAINVHSSHGALSTAAAT